MMFRHKFNHKAVVKDYSFDELISTRRLSIKMIVFYKKAYGLANSEMLKEQIQFELEWWNYHQDACCTELHNRINEQN